MQIDLLAFGAHPDDVELFCGGLLIKTAGLGYKTGVVDLTRGELGTRGNADLRTTEAQKAAEILNLAFRENAEIADGQIQITPENRLLVINFIRQFRPTLILAPFIEDRHPDHVHASHLISEASYYSGLRRIETGNPPFRPRAIIYYFMNTVKQPNLIANISAEFQLKIKALKAYQSQFFNNESTEPSTFISSKEFWEFIETRAKYFGQQIGVEYGEPFYVNSPIKIDNIFTIFP